MVISVAPEVPVFALRDHMAGMGASEYLENFIAYHAAPTVRGIKPATLVCPHREAAALRRALPECAERVGLHLGLGLAELSNRFGGFMVMAYQPCLLRMVLAARECADLLREAGFEDPERVETLFDQLRKKCLNCSFPHEIGVLLGYPPEDVRCFIRDGGKGAKVTGGWRAYSDVETARRRFSDFRSARGKAAELILSGATLDEVGRGLRTAG